MLDTEVPVLGYVYPPPEPEKPQGAGLGWYIFGLFMLLIGMVVWYVVTDQNDKLTGIPAILVGVAFALVISLLGSFTLFDYVTYLGDKRRLQELEAEYEEYEVQEQYAEPEQYEEGQTYYQQPPRRTYRQRRVNLNPASYEQEDDDGEQRRRRRRREER